MKTRPDSDSRTQLAEFREPGFKPPLYDVWRWATNKGHRYCGKEDEGIFESLLYTFTDRHDIVIDPFAGDGMTLDICRKRSRRCWASDKSPPVERAQEIRCHDLFADGVSGPRHWKHVKLVYLHPSVIDATPADALVKIIHAYAKKLKSGAFIACVTPAHGFDLYGRVSKGVVWDRRALCLGSPDQYTAQQVERAADDGTWLGLTRVVNIWRKVRNGEPGRQSCNARTRSTPAGGGRGCKSYAPKGLASPPKQ